MENNKNLEKRKLEYVKFLISNGIVLPNYEHILELNTSVSEAIATDTEKYKQFLLSDKVLYSELHQADLKGGNGYITDSEIIIPKSFDADEYFFGYGKVRVPYKLRSYIYPRTLDEFDLVISNNISSLDHLGEAIYKGNICNFAVGGIMDNEDNKRIDCDKCVKYLNMYGIDYDLIYDTLEHKQFYLVKSRNLKKTNFL